MGYTPIVLNQNKKSKPRFTFFVYPNNLKDPKNPNNPTPELPLATLPYDFPLFS